MSSAIDRVMAAFVRTHQVMTVEQAAEVRAQIAAFLREHSTPLVVEAIART